MRLCCLSTLSLALILLSAVLLPQTRAAAREPAKDKPYALIFGTVWGPEGQTLYGVKVKIRRADQKKAHWELYSDHHGEFAQRLPVEKADYLVEAETKDYKLPSGKHLQPGTPVTVHMDDPAVRYDVGLHLTY